MFANNKYLEQCNKHSACSPSKYAMDKAKGNRKQGLSVHKI